MMIIKIYEKYDLQENIMDKDDIIFCYVVVGFCMLGLLIFMQFSITPINNIVDFVLVTVMITVWALYASEIIDKLFFLTNMPKKPPSSNLIEGFKIEVVYNIMHIKSPLL